MSSGDGCKICKNGDCEELAYILFQYVLRLSSANLLHPLVDRNSDEYKDYMETYSRCIGIIYQGRYDTATRFGWPLHGPGRSEMWCAVEQLAAAYNKICSYYNNSRILKYPIDRDFLRNLSQVLCQLSECDPERVQPDRSCRSRKKRRGSLLLS